MDNSNPMHSSSRGTAQPLRLVVLGDCNTKTSDTNQGTVTESVCQSLKDHGFTVDLTNLGGGMETTREGLRRLSDHAEAADIAVINYGLVDSWFTSIPQVYIPYYPDSRLKKRARKILKSVKRRLRSQLVRKLIPTGPVVAKAEYSSNLRKIFDQLRSQNAATRIFAWSTVPVQNNAQKSADIVRYNEVLKDTCRQESVTFLDSPSLLQQLSPEQLFLDGVHLTRTAADIIGQNVVAGFLTEPKSIASTLRNRVA